MIKTIAIKPVDVGPMMVTWDLGRRCNYDCSYCESTHHNNYSRHRNVDELKSVFDFILEYTSTLNSVRKYPFNTHLNFTGGEPTVNPHFWKLVEYSKTVAPDFNLSLTTNGAWHSKHTQTIIDNFSGVTVSYHAEADESLRSSVLTNIIALSQSKLWLQVNLMMHVEHWDHCVSVYHILKEHNVNVKIRVIGDGNVTRKGWFQDSDGGNRRTTHEYSPEQIEWFWKQNGITDKPKSTETGTNVGRQCCGSRTLCGKVDNSWQPVNVINTEFKGWSCSVDYYFLHIDQETEEIYHHQTCKAKHGNTVGPIGSLSDTESVLNDLRNRLIVNEPIICPNNRCGCGMCVPKAQTLEEYKEIFNEVCR